MKDELIKKDDSSLVYKAEFEKRKTISFVWILPLLIFFALLYIAYDSYSKKGTNITVTFKSADGLKENVTALEYKGLQLGKVTKISIGEDLKSVKVNILVNSDVAKYVANENSKFWIKKPTVSLTKISGLNTLISGYKIELSHDFNSKDDLENIKEKYYFEGLEDRPDNEFDENGYYITLLTNNKDNIDIGTPIFYNKHQIGEITSKEFKNERLYVSAYIYDKYNYLVNTSSKFIVNEALKVSYGADGLNIEVGSLYSALVGGITVITEDKNKGKISKDEVYSLYSSKNDLKEKTYFTIDFYNLKIEENTPILFKGIEVGRVLNINLNKDFIKSTAYLYKEYEYLLTKNSQFFVEEPTISFDGIKNLGNIIKGNFVSIEYQDGDFSNHFVGQLQQGQIVSNPISFILKSDNLNSISQRSKIYYKNIQIGKVDSYWLSSDFNSVQIAISIDEKYKDLINNNTVFYDMSSKLVQIKDLNLDVNYSGLDSIFNGSIAISTNTKNSKLTKNEFKLYSSYSDFEKENFKDGFIVYSQFDNSFVIKENMKVVYKNQDIGFVKSVKFSDKVSDVELFIYEKYRKLIKNSSRFYKQAKLDLKASLSGIFFELDSFSSILDGTIKLDNSSTTPLGNHEIYASYDDMNLATNTITIVFDNVDGLKEDFSKITYKGVEVGKVKKISLKNEKVEVKAIIYDDFQSFAKDETIFYLKKPKISFQEVSNIGSTIMPVNIEVIKSQNKNARTKFLGYDKEPSINSSLGVVLKVEDKTASSVNENSPIYYKNVQIGKVLNVDLSPDASKVIIDCLIFDKYKHFVRTNSQFYDISGFEMEFSIFSGAKVESNTFASIIKGGLVVVTPYDYKDIATTQTRFILNKTLDENWKNISPSIR